MITDNLSAARGNSRGEINLQWDSDERAVSYVIEFSSFKLSENIRWKILDIISDSRYTVRNLKSNRIYSFRIAAVDENGKRESGINVSKKAP